MSAAIQQALVDELRLCAGGTPPTKSFLRDALGCSAAELAGAIQALRYQGKLHWERIELAASMLSDPDTQGASGTAREASSASSSGDATRDIVRAPTREEGPAAGAELPPAPIAGPDDVDDYPSEVNDQAAPAPSSSGSFVPKVLLHKAGTHGAMTRAANRRVPAPSHEPEVARQVREEVEEIRARSSRARSTGTVRVPLEIRKFGVPDMSFGEGVASLLAENPNDLMAAISRKHAASWRRIILLGRTRSERPAEALYAVLEAGLAALEEETTQGKAAA